MLDLLYLYPFYNKPEEMQELRPDEEYMQDDLNIELLAEYAGRSGSKALDKRIKIIDEHIRTMINLEQMKGYFSAELRGSTTYDKVCVKGPS